MKVGWIKNVKRYEAAMKRAHASCPDGAMVCFVDGTQRPTVCFAYGEASCFPSEGKTLEEALEGLASIGEALEFGAAEEAGR